MLHVARAIFGRYPESDESGVTLVDLRDDRQSDHDQVWQVLNESLALVREAGQGFPELVNDHLRRVVALDSHEDHASPFAQTLYSNFSAHDRRNPLYFASQLVWAATYVRLLRNQPWWRRSGHTARARLVARDAQVRLLRHFPDTEPWIADISRSSL